MASSIRSRAITRLLASMFATLLPLAAQAVTPQAEVEPNGTVAAATVLMRNAGRAIGAGSLKPGGDVDFWRIDGVPAGSRIWVSTDSGGTQNAGATSRDTVLDLIAADGITEIEGDDDDGTGNGADGTIETALASAIAGRTLVAGGTYYIRVAAFSATAIVDPYKLYVVVTSVAATPEAEANNTAATANVILSGSQPSNVISGSIGVAGDTDYYAYPLTAGDVVFISADADPVRVGFGTDLVVEVRDPSDALVLLIDSSTIGTSVNFAAEAAPYTALVSGTYFVKVRHSSVTGTGTYHLMVANMSPVATAPTLLGVAARRAHGGAGTFDLPLSAVLANPTTEPRLGPAHTVVFSFDDTVTGGNAGLTEGTAAIGALVFSGNELRVPLTGVTDGQYVTVTVSNVTTAGGESGGSGTARIGFLAGDVNQSRVVSLADLGLVNAQLAQPVTAANYLKDVNVSGTLTIADKSIANTNLTHALPPP